ncbi:MAG: hypothetical protein IKF45_04090 [Lachnospiraceae bacterium]|nr:hypothetical protein [Lachnospiraceae bacterium]MBR2995868.1 hypothetical protein [Lachnospiraceae bacterium]
MERRHIVKYTETFQELPLSVEEMKKMGLADLSSPSRVAALTVVAIYAYTVNKQQGIEMIDYLRGPRPLTEYEKQFLRDRLGGKEYVIKSFFQGAVPDNNYTMSKPYTVIVEDAPQVVSEEGYKRFQLRSGGADNPRTITLRNKPSTGEWFLWEQVLLADIRPPKSQDDWA